MDEYWNLASTAGQTIYINSDLLASRGTDWWTIAGTFFSTVTAIAGVGIAWRAHFLSRNEAENNRKHNTLSVRPLIEINDEVFFGDTEDRNKKFSVFINNKGIGPAIINKVVICMSDEVLYESDKNETKAKYLGSNKKDYRIALGNSLGCGKVNINTRTPEYDSIFSPNESLSVIEITFLDLYLPPSKFIEETSKLNLYLEYRDIYDQQMDPINYTTS